MKMKTIKFVYALVIISLIISLCGCAQTWQSLANEECKRLGHHKSTAYTSKYVYNRGLISIECDNDYRYLNCSYAQKCVAIDEWNQCQKHIRDIHCETEKGEE